MLVLLVIYVIGKYITYSITQQANTVAGCRSWIEVLAGRGSPPRQPRWAVPHRARLIPCTTGRLRQKDYLIRQSLSLSHVHWTDKVAHARHGNGKWLGWGYRTSTYWHTRWRSVTWREPNTFSMRVTLYFSINKWIYVYSEAQSSPYWDPRQLWYNYTTISWRKFYGGCPN